MLFLLDHGKGFILGFFGMFVGGFSFPHYSWGWRLDLSLSSQEAGTEGPLSYLSPFPLLTSLVFSIIFLLGDLQGESAGVWVMKVRCRCGEALLLAGKGHSK